MNIRNLAGLYDRLKPVERLPLMMAASMRDDQIESNRLAQSAPTILRRLPDYHGYAEGWLMLTFFHMIEQLNFVATYWSNLALTAECGSFPDSSDDPAQAERFFGIAKMAAYRLCLEADAWKLVCAERNVEPDLLPRALRGFETILQTEASVRLTLWTAEEAAGYWKKRGGKDDDLPTVERAAQLMRDMIDGRVKWWNG